MADNFFCLDIDEKFTKVADSKKVGDTLEVTTLGKAETSEFFYTGDQEKNIKAEDSSLVWSPKNEIKIENPKAKEKLGKLFEALDENEDVNEVYTNMNP